MDRTRLRRHVVALLCLVGVGAFTGCAGGIADRWPSALSLGRAKPDAVGPHVQSPGERMEALRELAERGPRMQPAEAEAVSRQLAAEIRSTEDSLVRAEILKTLARMPTVAAADVLVSGLEDPDSDVRVTACEAWGERGGPEAIRRLSEKVSSDTDIDVRLAAARALGETADPAAVAALGQALEDPNPAMQYRAVDSLRQVTGRDLGSNVNAWRAYVQGDPPSTLRDEESIASRWLPWLR